MNNSVLPETKTIISYIFKIFTDWTPMQINTPWLINICNTCNGMNFVTISRSVEIKVRDSFSNVVEYTNTWWDKD